MLWGVKLMESDKTKEGSHMKETEHSSAHEHKSSSESKHSTHKHYTSKSTKSSTPWIIATLVLAVLLIASILTHGFTINNSEVDLVVQQINDLKAKTASPEARARLDSIKEELIETKQLIVENQKNNLPASTSALNSTEHSTQLESSSAKSSVGSVNRVKLDFYVMSMCPFGTQVEDAVAPVLKNLSGYVDFNINFIANIDGDGNFASLHGEKEVKGDIVQLCAMKYNPEKYMDMIVCMNKNAREIPDNWEDCAKQYGLDIDKIKQCYEGDEGKVLLKKSIQKSNDIGARGSPTMYLNDKPYNGGRSELDFMRALCNALNNTPDACANVPPPVEVTLINLNDKRCKDCDDSSVISQLKILFPGLKVENVDYGSEKGKKLYNDLNLTYLPAVLFDKSVQKGEGFTRVARWLEKKGDYYSLRIGASFDPTREICDNGIDDTGNGKIDCEDADCANAMACRPEKNNTLDLFVMSHCPYGIMAMNAMKEVLEAFPDINFSIHYIASVNGDQFSSLHGQKEVQDDIRELCVMKYAPDNYMDFIWCRNKNINSDDWESCVNTTTMDLDKIRECSSSDEGKNLLKKDLQIAKDLKIGASPTWMANNRYLFSGIDAETVRKNLCDKNPGLEGCDTKLSAQTNVKAGQC